MAEVGSQKDSQAPPEQSQSQSQPELGSQEDVLASQAVLSQEPGSQLELQTGIQEPIPTESAEVANLGGSEGTVDTSEVADESGTVETAEVITEEAVDHILGLIQSGNHLPLG